MWVLSTGNSPPSRAAPIVRALARRTPSCARAAPSLLTNSPSMTMSVSVMLPARSPGQQPDQVDNLLRVGEAASRGAGDGLLGDLVGMAVRGLGDGGGHAVVPRHRSVSTRVASRLAGSSPRFPSGRVAGIGWWRREPTANPPSGCTYGTHGPSGTPMGCCCSPWPAAGSAR